MKLQIVKALGEIKLNFVYNATSLKSDMVFEWGKCRSRN